MNKLFNFSEIDYSDTTNFNIDQLLNFVDSHFDSEFSRCLKIYEKFDKNEMFVELGDLCHMHKRELCKVIDERFNNLVISDSQRLKIVIISRNKVLKKRRTLLYIELTE